MAEAGTWLFDGLLALLLLTVANRALHARTLFAAVMMFIAFGLVLALAWGRLGAPDLALAEAAIGAGLTGALLFSALPQVSIETRDHHRQHPLLPVLFIALVLPLLAQALWSLPGEPAELADLARQQVPHSGVEHPVTAVLLNFRSWDTLLELLVLLVALTGLRQLAPGHKVEPRPWPVLRVWGQMLVPLTLVVGGYVLWRGSSAPGGAFQAGAIIAAGAVMLRLNRMLPPLRWSHWAVRSATLVGVALFIFVGVAEMFAGNGWLTYPPAFSGTLILIIETAATLSIAITLTLLVVGERSEVCS